ncbi:winged helix-turn-helix domain-containing protein [Priestia megaterium]|uniref:winged helix-turn-helix domain-containing protein n=1 Tax=Priestia megaterium TaxID=1404 RepID=UPI002E249A20|nr:winged helix-turn-helix domain-containing protein [Priestia megaterium]
MAKVWTDEENEFLEQHAGKMTIPTLAKRISEEFGNNRTVAGVQARLKRLGITNLLQETGRMTMNELSVLIGADHKAIRRWIENGWLPYVKRKVVFKRQFYLIKATSFWEFAEKHKDQVNFLRIEPNSIAPEPEWVEAERKKEYYDTPKRQSKLWDKEQDELLISMKKAGYSIKEISERLKRTVSSVHSRKKMLTDKGFILPDQITLRWTDKEIQLFYKLEQEGYTDKQIACELGREEYHIRRKRFSLRKSGKYKGAKQKWEHGKVS